MFHSSAGGQRRGCAMLSQLSNVVTNKQPFSNGFLLFSFNCPTWHRKPQVPLSVNSAPIRSQTEISCCRVSTAGFQLLKDVDVQRAFIKSSWGVEPVFLPDLLPDFVSPVTPDDIAALSEDPCLHSRIILTNDACDNRQNEPLYTLRLGPFPEDTWETLPASKWTLLVQGVERRVPQLRDLLDKFSFIPNWRVDDIQVSYATTGGGVGPHVDNYDVFLIQAAGVRKWRVGHKPIPPDREVLEPDLDVRVLKGGLKPDAEYILRPGDALYVPPRFPHWGISQDDECITLSVGFRAPAVSNLLSGWVEHVIDSRGLDETFYVDDINDLSESVGDPGRISKRAVNNALDCLKQLFNDDERVRRDFYTWFAQEVSQRKTFLTDDDELVDGVTGDSLEDSMLQIFSTSGSSFGEVFVCQQIGAVFTYTEIEDRGRCVMYIDGTSWPVDSVEIARLLCSRRRVSTSEYQALAKSNSSIVLLVRNLLSAGLLRIEVQNDLDRHD